MAASTGDWRWLNESCGFFIQPVETPLSEEPWFHGAIARDEAESKLQEDGDYLVRESSRKPGQFVLTVKWSTFRHFIVQQDEMVRGAKEA